MSGNLSLSSGFANRVGVRVFCKAVTHVIIAERSTALCIFSRTAFRSMPTRNSRPLCAGSKFYVGHVTLTFCGTLLRSSCPQAVELKGRDRTVIWQEVCTVEQSLISVGSGHQSDRAPSPRSVNNFIKLRFAAAQRSAVCTGAIWRRCGLIQEATAT